MTSSKTSTAPLAGATANPLVLHQSVVGSRRFSNLFWATVVQIGGAGFLLAGASSYLRVNLLPFSDPIQLVFLPQGLAMSFYGVSATLLGLYLWLTMFWDVGGGYNEFDKKNGLVTIFRWGFPGKNRKIELTCKTDEVQAVKVDLRDGLSPRRSLYLRVKSRRDIPLTRVGQPMSLSELENQGAELARFLEVPLEGL
jgi:Ycf4